MSDDTPTSWWHTFLGWPRAVRISAYVALGLVLVLIAALVTGVVLVRRPFPQTTGTVDVPGLDDARIPWTAW